MTKELTLEDLSNITGLTLRTLRFYMQEGILQGPDTHGKNARYSQKHLDQLELIQRLKNLHVPLQEIRHLLNNITPQEITRLRKYQEKLQPTLNEDKSVYAMEPPTYQPSESALGYIRSLENKWSKYQIISEPRIDLSRSTPPSPASSAIPDSIHYSQFDNQETWSRIVIEDGIELNIRQPIELEEQEKLVKLVEYARDLFGHQSKKGDKK
jgi:DNA-binding transcriptional MerR regulator